MSGTSGEDTGDTGDAVLSPEEQRVRDLLRAVPDAGPMPADVVARLDAALAAARPGSPVASLAARRARGRRLPRLLAAAAGIVVLGGAVVAGQHLPSAGSSGSAGSSAADSAADAPAMAADAPAMAEAVPPDVRVLLSGQDYTDASAVQDLAEDTLAQDAGSGGGGGTGGGGRAPDATAGTDATDSGKTMLLAPSDGGSATSDPSQRPAAERAVACVAGLGVDPASVLVVEIASWRAVPAALVVHRTDDGAEVVVVGLDCTPGDTAFSRVDVPLPAAP